VRIYCEIISQIEPGGINGRLGESGFRPGVELQNRNGQKWAENGVYIARTDAAPRYAADGLASLLSVEESSILRRFAMRISNIVDGLSTGGQTSRRRRGGIGIAPLRNAPVGAVCDHAKC